MSFRRIGSVIINGKRWAYGFGYPCGEKVRGKIRVHDGICSWQKRRIIIQRGVKGRERSLEETVIHEVAHAVLTSMIAEETIEELASKTYKILKRMRKEEPPGG